MKLTVACLLLSIIVRSTSHSLGFAQVPSGLVTKTDTVIIGPALPRYIIKHTYPTESHINHTLNKFEISQVDDSSVHQTILDTGNYAHKYELVHLNFDGYSDLKIQGDDAEYGELSTIYLFDSLTKAFSFCSELSGLANLSVDPSEQEVTSSEQFPGGRESESCSYKFQNGHFRLTYRDSYLDNVRTIMSLMNDSLIVVKWIETREETPNTPTFVTYQLLDDSLLLTQKETKVGVHYASNKQKQNGILTNEDHWACYLLKNETYHYFTDEHGRKYVKVTVKEAKNGRWITTRHERISR